MCPTPVTAFLFVSVTHNFTYMSNQARCSSCSTFVDSVKRLVIPLYVMLGIPRSISFGKSHIQVEREKDTQRG